LNGQWITSEASDYSYGDGFGNPTHIQTTTTDKDPTSPFFGQAWQKIVDSSFANDGANWCYGLPTGITVQSLVPGQTARTRTFSNVLDSNASLCRIAQKTIEPTSTNQVLTVTTTLGFSAAGCGNVTSKSVVGHNPDGSAMAARTTTLDYGTRCQLPETVQNPLGQSSTLTYNYDFGIAAMIKDPNTVAISWSYDDFGRRSQETRPDGTYSVYNYYSCTTITRAILLLVGA
jgi:YD repeat-containing protein